MKSSLLKSMSFVAFLATATPSLAADPVVADVNGKKFTYSQVMEAKDSLPKQYQSAPDDKIFPVLLNQAVDTYLIGIAAAASGEADKPETKAAIAKAAESIVAQAYLISKIKNQITDAAVKAKYDNEIIKNFPKEKEIHLRHILVDNKDIALSVIKALKNGTDFKKLAQSKSKDPTGKEGGELGWFRKGELPQELADAAFALTPKSYSQEAIKSDFGWHVLMVDEIRDAQPPKFDEIKNEIKSLMTQEAVVLLLKDLRANAKIKLFNKDGKPMPLEAAETTEKALESAAPEAAPAAPEAAPTAPEAAPAAPATPEATPSVPAPAAPAPAEK